MVVKLGPYAVAKKGHAKAVRSVDGMDGAMVDELVENSDAC